MGAMQGSVESIVVDELAQPDPTEALAEARLRNAFWRGLGLQPGTDLGELALGEHDRWDSLGHMALIAAIEEAFGVMLPEDAVFALTDFRAARAIVLTHCVAVVGPK